MTMFIYFFCLCPLSLAITLNFDISKVAYYVMVCVLGSRLRDPGSRLGRGHCAVFLSKSFSSHSASYHPGVQFRYQQIQCLLWITLRWTGIPFRGKSGYSLSLRANERSAKNRYP